MARSISKFDGLICVTLSRSFQVRPLLSMGQAFSGRSIPRDARAASGGPCKGRAAFWLMAECWAEAIRVLMQQTELWWRRHSPQLCFSGVKHTAGCTLAHDLTQPNTRLLDGPQLCGGYVDNL